RGAESAGSDRGRARFAGERARWTSVYSGWRQRANFLLKTFAGARLQPGTGQLFRWPRYSLARPPDGMSTFDDENIEFDLFDEPETEEASRPRRRVRRERSGPPRPPGPPTGLVPLARLVGLIAIAIAIVVAFVFWVGACQGKSTHDQYASYATRVRTVAASSNALGREFASKLGSSVLKQ